MSDPLRAPVVGQREALVASVTFFFGCCLSSLYVFAVHGVGALILCPHTFIWCVMVAVLFSHSALIASIDHMHLLFALTIVLFITSLFSSLAMREPLPLDCYPFI